MRLPCLLLLTGLLATAATAAAQNTDAAALLRLAQQQEAAGKLEAAAETYNKAAAAFHVAGNPTQEAAAYGKSAAANERYADQLLGTTAAPAAPVTHAAPAKAAAALAPRPAAPAPAAKVPGVKIPGAVPRPAPHSTVAVGPAPTAGHLVGGKPVGLFFVTRTILGNFRTMSYYFSPEGIAYEEPLGLSAAELAATPARSKGRYTVKGRTLSIAWTGYPKPETADMTLLSGGFSWSGGALFSGVGPFRSAGQLVGSYSGGSSAYTGSGGVLSSKDITFRADGTYTGGGVVSFTNVTESSVAEGGSSSQQAGHWRLDGWYLTLTDAQGHTIRDVAYPVNTGDRQVTLFNFNGTAYSRR